MSSKRFGFKIEVPHGEDVVLMTMVPSRDHAELAKEILVAQSQYIVACLQEFIDTGGQGTAWISGAIDSQVYIRYKEAQLKLAESESRINTLVGEMSSE